MPLNPGDAAPDFELMDQDMETVKLSDLKGSRVVLLFYPMDFSPVCTDEHCTFSPAKGDLFGDAKVFGVSTDSPFSHKAYKEQYKIDYPLLADVTREMVKSYDMYADGTPFNCGARGTVVIDADGKIEKWDKVEMGVARSADQVKV